MITPTEAIEYITSHREPQLAYEWITEQMGETVEQWMRENLEMIEGISRGEEEMPSLSDLQEEISEYEAFLAFEIPAWTQTELDEIECGLYA